MENSKIHCPILPAVRRGAQARSPAAECRAEALQKPGSGAWQPQAPLARYLGQLRWIGQTTALGGMDGCLGTRTRCLGAWGERCPGWLLGRAHQQSRHWEMM